MKLIADCGSTKIDWCVVEGQKLVERFETTGMNAVMLTRQEIAERIAQEVAPRLPKGIEHVYFYGAGCISPEVCANVAEAIRESVPADDIQVATDLLGAARALCGNTRGIACILGTGSNACYYDGEGIVRNVSPLGYILGDEGSGAVLGKLLVGNVLKRQLPDDLCEKFLKQYDLDALKIIQKVYREPAGNRFLASLSPFLLQNIDRPEIAAMTREALYQFFKRNVRQLADQYIAIEPTAHFVGSIAYYYRPQLEQAAAECGIAVGTVLRNPMEGLIQFHK